MQLTYQKKVKDAEGKNILTGQAWRLRRAAACVGRTGGSVGLQTRRDWMALSSRRTRSTLSAPRVGAKTKKESRGSPFYRDWVINQKRAGRSLPKRR